MNDAHVPLPTSVFFPRWLRAILLVLSAAAFLLGVFALFVTDNDAGTAALLAVSVALLALGIFADRISTVEAGGVKLGLVVADQLARAEVAAEEGRDDDAERLRESARTLLALADPVSSNFDAVRRSMPSSWARTAKLEALMQQARELAGAVTSADEVRRLFSSGKDGDRLSAIGIMQARPEFVDLQCLTDAVSRSRSAFEQYQALRAVEEVVTRPGNQSVIRDDLTDMVVEALDRGAIRPGPSDRRLVAERILQSRY